MIFLETQPHLFFFKDALFIENMEDIMYHLRGKYTKEASIHNFLIKLCS